MVKNLPAVQETQVRSLGWEVPLVKRMATPSSILAWRIPWTEEPGGLQSMESQRVGYDLEIESQQQRSKDKSWLMWRSGSSTSSLRLSPGQFLLRSLLDWAPTHHICYVLYTLLGDFIFLTSFHCHNSLVTIIGIIISSCRWGKWNSERLNNLPNTTEPVKRGVQTCTQI